MIPRRRIPLEFADFLEWIRAPFLAARAAADVAAFEREFGERFQVPHAIAVASGRDALGLIVDGLGLTAGDEVVIPAYTLGELLPFLQGRGLTLVPADVDRDSFNVTADSVRRACSPRTRAILVVHLLGAPCDIVGILAIAEQLGIPLIEDCAHAPGAEVAGRPLGSFGRAALFSLEVNKALMAFGGGILATHDDTLAAQARAAVARRPRREWPAMKKMALKWIEELGVRSPLYGPLARYLFSDRRAGSFDRLYRKANNRVRSHFAFSGFQARLARRRLARLDDRQARLSELWSQTVAVLPAALRVQRRQQFGTPAFYNLVVRFDGDVRSLRQRALAAGIDLGIGDEVMSDCAALLGRPDCPVSADVFAHAVLLPVYDGLPESARRRLLARLDALLQGSAAEVAA